MLRLVVFAVVVVAANCALLFGQWENFKLRHGKEYTDNENAKRRAIYEENMKYIQKHNAEQHSYKLGENEYADWTNEEFRKYMNGWRQTSKRRPAPMHEPQMGDLPEEVNWKDEGYVTGVKNQRMCVAMSIRVDTFVRGRLIDDIQFVIKQCGSCWSFSATGALEGQNFKMNRKLISLSEQNLIDCSRAEGNMGCEGGLMDLAFAYVQMNDGIDTEESYPYTAMDGPMCKYTLENKAATDVGYRDIKSMDEMALKEAVANVGPISVAIDASKKSFQLYSSGVYRDDTCSQTVLDHGVLAVGYGTDDMSGMDYWLVKNSWGMSWGMEGYIKMARNRDNMCGIATNASYPIVP